MPLTPYAYRPLTPPVAEVPGLSGRRPSDASQWSMESFPDSIEQHARTPLDRSPARHPGQKLLPKLRTQDHMLEPSSHNIPVTTQHRRAVSTSFEVRQQHYEQSRRAVSTGYEAPPEVTNPVFAIHGASAASSRSGTIATSEPLETPDPESAISTCFSVWSDLASIESPVSFLPASGTFRNASHGHGRSVSASYIDHSTLLKYCPPVYRPIPGYINYDAHWSEIDPNGASTFLTEPLSAIEATATHEWDLPQELQFTQPDDATQTLDTYLRAHNPALDLCQSATAPLGRSTQQQHFWWDIRNLRAWDSFSLQSITSVPGFPELLQVHVPSAALPDYASQLTRALLSPEDESVLTNTARTYFAAKVNAALKVAMPAHQVMAMHPCRDRDGPAFVSNYQNDAEQTFAGNGRGRVVGIVRSYRAWNSGLRSGNGVQRVKYLDGLAMLHRHMREHQTRYGFILTETELVCVRAGTEETPYFGLLELATPIELRLHGGASPATDEFGNLVHNDLPTPPHSDIDGPPLTACLALWYLHMLAKEEPLPGQPSWRLHIGAPAAMTRQRVLAQKDKWIPPPQKRECRDSKTMRGWVWPTDPWNKKREGRVSGRR